MVRSPLEPYPEVLLIIFAHLPGTPKVASTPHSNNRFTSKSETGFAIMLSFLSHGFPGASAAYDPKLKIWRCDIDSTMTYGSFATWGVVHEP
jgi:hypothetical protein